MSRCVIDRIRQNRSFIEASCGNNSVNRILESRVGIVLNSPRISAGASGFGSNVSSCGGPPVRKSNTQRFAFPNESFPPRTGRTEPNVPRTPRVPKRRNSRRQTLWCEWGVREPECDTNSSSLRRSFTVRHNVLSGSGRETSIRSLHAYPDARMVWGYSIALSRNGEAGSPFRLPWLSDAVQRKSAGFISR